MDKVYIVVWTGNGRIAHPKGIEYPYFFTDKKRTEKYCDRLNNPTGIRGKISKGLSYLTGDCWMVKTLGMTK